MADQVEDLVEVCDVLRVLSVREPGGFGKTYLLGETRERYLSGEGGELERVPYWLAFLAYLAHLAYIIHATRRPARSSETVVLVWLVVMVCLVLVVLALVVAGAPEVVADVVQRWPFP